MTNVSPVNPDRRTLPPGWNEHYDVSIQTRYYTRPDDHPPRVSVTHPLELPIVQDEDVHNTHVPGTNSPVQAASFSSAQLCRSTTMQMFAPTSPPAPSMPFLTPSSSPDLIDFDPVHVSHYHPASPPHSHNHTTPMLTAKTEASDEHKFTKSISQVHTTSAPPPHTHPHVQCDMVACLSPSNTPSMIASASINPQQHVFQTPLSQSQVTCLTIEHTREQYQSVYNVPQSSHVTPAPYAVTQTAAQQLLAQAQAQHAAIAQAQATVIRNQQKQLEYHQKQLAYQQQQLACQQQQLACQHQQLASQQQQLAFQQQMGVVMYGQKQRQENLKNRLLGEFVRGAVEGAVGAVLGC